MTTITAHWSANPAVLAGCFVTAVIHLAGLRQLRRDDGARRQPGRRTSEAVIFYAGLLAVAAALVSPAGYWSVRYIWVRTVQDLLLAVVAPPLIVLGAPWLALRRGARAAGPRPARRAPGAPGARAAGTPGRWATGAPGTWATGAPGTGPTHVHLAVRPGTKVISALRNVIRNIPELEVTAGQKPPGGKITYVFE